MKVRTRKWTRVARWELLAPFAGLLFGLAAAPAHATATLTISDGGIPLVLNDGGTGLIDFAGPLGGWLLNVDVATTEPLSGSPQYPDMHLSVIAIGQGSLDVNFTDSALLGGGLTDFVTQLGGVIGGGPGSSVSLNSSTTAGGLASFGPLDPSSPPAGVQSDWQWVTGPYSLSLAVAITNAQWGDTSLDTSVAVPEPATLALLAAALFGCGLIRATRLPGARRQRIAGSASR